MLVMFVCQPGLVSTHSLRTCEPVAFGTALLGLQTLGSLAYWKRWNAFQVKLIRSLPFCLHWTKSQLRHPLKTLLKELKGRYVLIFCKPFRSPAQTTSQLYLIVWASIPRVPLELLRNW